MFNNVKQLLSKVLIASLLTGCVGILPSQPVHAETTSTPKLYIGSTAADIASKEKGFSI